MLYNIIKKILFRCDSEFSHYAGLWALKYFYRPLASLFAKSQLDFPVECMGLEFKNPIGLAAGFDKNADYIDALFSLGFGFIEVGTVTPRAQCGNPKPRLFRVIEQQALINRLGFNNKGLDYVVSRLKKAKRSGIVGVNIGKNADTPLDRAVDDYKACLSKVYALADYVVVNISSPNTPGLRLLQSAEYFDDLMRTLMAERDKLTQQFQVRVPILVKITVDLADADWRHLIDILIKYHIDGVVCSNTTLDHALVSAHPNGEEVGGVSGAPLTDRANNMLADITRYARNQLTVFGVGGIMCGQSMQAKFSAGADLVQLYTGLVYNGPDFVRQLLAALSSVQVNNDSRSVI